MGWRGRRTVWPLEAKKSRKLWRMALLFIFEGVGVNDGQ